MRGQSIAQHIAYIPAREETWSSGLDAGTGNGVMGGYELAGGGGKRVRRGGVSN